MISDRLSSTAAKISVNQFIPARMRTTRLRPINTNPAASSFARSSLYSRNSRCHSIIAVPNTTRQNTVVIDGKELDGWVSPRKNAGPQFTVNTLKKKANGIISAYTGNKHAIPRSDRKVLFLMSTPTANKIKDAATTSATQPSSCVNA